MDEDNEKNMIKKVSVRKSLTTFPYSKTTCVCNCGKYSLQDLPNLRKILPEGYDYKLCEYLPLDRDDKFLVTMRMNLATQQGAMEWKRKFEEKSLTTHVKDKTFPKVERVSIFKAQYRCQFFDRRKNKKKLPDKSKFRECHSILFMNIKKYFKNTVDCHMPAYQTVVRLHYAHDHPLDTADVLRKRQLNDDIRCRFLDMFRQGIKPKDALDKHKRELLQNLGAERYRQVLCDGYYVPNVPKTYRLYYQIHGKGVSAKTTTKRSSRKNPNPDLIAFQDFPCVVTNADIDDNDHNNEVAGDGSSAVEESDNELNIGQTCLETGFQNEGSLTSKVTISQTLPQTSRPIMNTGSGHGLMSSADQLEKMVDTHITYPNISAHNSYTEITGKISASSFSDPHLGMDLLSFSHSTWEHFAMTHQQGQPTVTSNIQQQSQPVVISDIQQQQSSLGFQTFGHQTISDSSHMILSNTSCSKHYVSSLETMDHSTGLQDTVSRKIPANRNVTDPHVDPECPWNQLQSQHNVNLSQVSSYEDAVIPSKHLQNKTNAPRKLCVKKKKKNASKELNMKHVTKQWLEKKPKVETETQSLASEVLQTILLADEAEKLKVKLVTFLSDLESKMTSSPKLFVPAIRQFLQASQAAESELKLATYLKDFGKTEENVVQSFQARRKESGESCSTQTELSGPVVGLGCIKSVRSSSVCSLPVINDKSLSVQKLKKSGQQSKACRKQKSKITGINRELRVL